MHLVLLTRPIRISLMRSIMRRGVSSRMPLVFVFIWIGSRDVGVFHMQKLVVVRMIAGIFIPYIVLDWRPFLYYLLIRHFIVVTFQVNNTAISTRIYICARRV